MRNTDEFNSVSIKVLKMAKTCPSCNAELCGSEKKSSALLPILTAVGVSAAAILVLRKIRNSSAGQADKDVLADCSRAARALDQRIDGGLRIAG